jgi:DNA-binding MarR family transcriptional regulator
VRRLVSHVGSTLYPDGMAVSAQTPAHPFTEAEAAAWVGFLRSHATLVRELDATLSEAHGMPLSSYEVLLRLSREPEGRQRMSDLADSVWLSRSGITRLIDRLERDGLVERRACASDARGSFAVITDEGRRRLDAARATHVADVRERFLSRFDRDEQAQLAEFWSRLG